MPIKDTLKVAIWMLLWLIQFQFSIKISNKSSLRCNLELVPLSIKEHLWHLKSH